VFTLDSLLKITKVAHTVGLLFTQLGLCIIFDKKGLGYIFGDFLRNFSGQITPIRRNLAQSGHPEGKLSNDARNATLQTTTTD
jgi:hypothetical protein